MVAGLVGINRLGQALQDLLAQPFELVRGRRIYDMFAAYWPRVRADSPSHAIADLFNELRLLIHPVVLARGKRLFGDDGRASAFALADSICTPGGVLITRYVHVGPDRAIMGTGTFQRSHARWFRAPDRDPDHDGGAHEASQEHDLPLVQP